MAPMSPRSGTRATIRGGTDVVPAESAMSARASASRRTSTSSRPSTCARLKYRMRFTRRSLAGKGRRSQSLLVRGNLRHHAPYVLHEGVERGLSQSLDVTVGAVAEIVRFRRGGADTVGLN